MLEAKHLHKKYTQAANELHILKGIDLKVEEGDVLAILGPSGAGKSTLLHILGGLDKPQEGQVIFDGEDLYGLSDVQLAGIRNRKVGFIFQFYHLLSEFSALENVMLPALVNESSENIQDLKKKGEELLDRVGLIDRAKHKPSQLSGGEQQRVAIARALINHPRVIFCDEPTGNLDSETGQGIVELLLELNQRNKQTLVIVTHDEQIAKRSHKTIRLHDGQLIG